MNPLRSLLLPARFASLNLCPWRIEVGDPGQGARSLFLHVFEVADEKGSQPAVVKFVPPAGVQIGSRWQLQFSATGTQGGKVGECLLATTINNEKQYRAEGR